MPTRFTPQGIRLRRESVNSSLLTHNMLGIKTPLNDNFSDSKRGQLWGSRTGQNSTPTGVTLLG